MIFLNPCVQFLFFKTSHVILQKEGNGFFIALIAVLQPHTQKSHDIKNLTKHVV